MKCTKPGNRKEDQIFKGRCRSCEAEFETVRSILKVDYCSRENYEFAHADCSECGKKAPMAVILYPNL